MATGAADTIEMENFSSRSSSTTHRRPMQGLRRRLEEGVAAGESITMRSLGATPL